MLIENIKHSNMSFILKNIFNSDENDRILSVYLRLEENAAVLLNNFFCLVIKKHCFRK